MEKPMKIICLCVIIILCVSFIIYHVNYSNNKDSVKIDHTYFTLPNGYYKLNSGDNFLNITNGTTELYLYCFNDSDIIGHVENYTKMKNKDNITIEKSQFTINNTEVYKSYVKNETQVCHYWFVNDNKVYEMFTWHATPNTDKIVEKMVGSIHTSIF